MAEYLFLGGEFHGTMRDPGQDEKGFDRPQVTAFAAPIPGIHNLGDQLDPANMFGGGRIAQNWYRRDLMATDHTTGTTYRRTCYIHQHWSSSPEMVTLLGAYLMLEWAKQGEAVDA